ncbi:MAG: DNA-directed DNA polymerase II small subunit [Petrotogales bacterium]
MKNEFKSILDEAIDLGYQLSPNSYEWLKQYTVVEAKELINQAIRKASQSSEDRIVLDLDFIKSLIYDEKTHKKDRYLQYRSKKIETDIKILNDEESLPAGDVEGFVEYFKSRYNRLSNILRKRLDARDSIDIARSRKMPLKSEFKIIGMIRNKRSRGNRIFYEIEDPKDKITILASDKEVVEKGLSILDDQVICVETLKYKEDLLIAKNFIFPDIPSKRPRRASEQVCAAFLSDLHIGSNSFREDLFEKFIDWIKMEAGNDKHRELASRVKYIIIAGDLVDGVGVYPEQLSELNIKNIKDQYRYASKLVERIPSHIEIIIIPGNHDAVRRSLPQPSISKEYAPILHEDPRVHLYGNPCRLSLNGVNILIDHGKALDDILTSTPRLEFHNPVGGMELLLKARHLAPCYGRTTPIAPEKKDRLVISSVPDVFLMGHTHIYDIKNYKGVTLNCSGTFQDRTPFQKKMDIHPTVGISTIFNLQTHQYYRLDVNQFI